MAIQIEKIICPKLIFNIGTTDKSLPQILIKFEDGNPVAIMCGFYNTGEGPSCHASQNITGFTNYCPYSEWKETRK